MQPAYSSDHVKPIKIVFAIVPQAIDIPIGFLWRDYCQLVKNMILPISQLLLTSRVATTDSPSQLLYDMIHIRRIR